MFDSSPCVMLCEQKVQISYIIRENGTQKQLKKTEIYGTNLCVKSQMSFSLTYKHRCVVHSHRVQSSSNTLIAEIYINHISRNF